MFAYRIGIDVGGTFTHAVALESTTFALAGQSKVSTTHRSPRGVAEGVIQALRELLDGPGMMASQIGFLAYSTTQVTNALLEGDAAPVGIIAIGAGLEGKRAISETRLGDIEMAPGRVLRTFHTYLDRDEIHGEAARKAVERLAAEGAQAVVAAEAFSVDDPARERLIAAAAGETGLPATGTHEVSGRYGLRARTRTAVINASLLPKAIATANMVEQAVREMGIACPLMVVRSDGGVMSMEDLRRRPVLSLLSGPAAGVAAALMYLQISNGVFVEVGGTSTDITAIEHGRALLRSAEVGGHRLFLRTLDVRTIGVAGGSLPRIRDGALCDVGPRSAHLAGLRYACFVDPGELAGPEPAMRAVSFSPLSGDPGDYAAVELPSGERLAATVTCAANALGQVPEGDWARGDQLPAREAFAAVGRLLGKSPEEAADAVLTRAAQKAARTVLELLADRNMSQDTTDLVGGGGGAGALVPAVGKLLEMPVRIAPEAAVVSAIGTALALVREVVERTVPNPSEVDMLSIRREAAEAVIRSGASPESVTVELEYDARTAVLRASAAGQVELRAREAARPLADDEERLAAAAKSLRTARERVETVADAGLLRGYRAAHLRKRLLGLVTERRETTALVDQQGVTRLVVGGGEVRAAPAGMARQAMMEMLEARTRYGDAGAELPQVFLGVRGRIVNLSGLATAAQVLTLAQAETSALPAEEMVLVVVAPRGG